MDKKTEMMVDKLDNKLPPIPIVYCAWCGRKLKHKIVNELEAYDMSSGEQIRKYYLFMKCPSMLPWHSKLTYKPWGEDWSRCSR